jgi:6-phosphofructokinase 1
VAEGACDRRHAHHHRLRPPDAAGSLGEDTRSTILGHVQRGGSPSAFDRWMSTLVGAAAADEVLGANFDTGPKLIGLRFNRVMRAPLMASVELTHDVGTHIANGHYDEAMRLRGNSFNEMLQIFNALSRALPSSTPPPTRRRIAVLHGDGPAPGMNTAVRAAVRLGLDAGHTMLGVSDGIEGLMEGRVRVLDWRSVDGWNASGGAELGTSRWVPSAAAVEQIALQLAAHDVHALLVIGGWSGYEAMDVLARAREHYPLLAMPVVCVPATINNDLPHSELAIGADTALNSIVEALDRLKQSAVAVNRCFLVEVMGRYCGYLAAMSALASGAERIYLHERGITLDELRADVVRMRAEFSAGKRLSLVVRNEHAHPQYTTDFITRLFEAESAEVSTWARRAGAHPAGRQPDAVRPDPRRAICGEGDGHDRPGARAWRHGGALSRRRRGPVDVAKPGRCAGHVRSAHPPSPQAVVARPGADGRTPGLRPTLTTTSIPA